MHSDVGDRAAAPYGSVTGTCPDRRSGVAISQQNGDAVIATPPTRLTDPPVPAPPFPGRAVTAEQVANAVLQLRERRGRPPVEQVRAILRALDLTVVPDPVIPRQR